MTSKKRKPLSTMQRRAKLEPNLAVEAQMARLEKNRSLGLAAQDHFVLWNRPTLFVPWSPELLQ